MGQEARCQAVAKGASLLSHTLSPCAATPHTPSFVALFQTSSSSHVTRLCWTQLTRRSPTTLSDSRSSSPRGRDGTSSERRTSRRRRLRLKRRASPGGTLRLYAVC